MTRYYFLGSLLPDLEVGYPPELPFEQLAELLAVNLAPVDLEKVATIRRYYDIQNIRAFWQNKPLSPYGNLDAHQLEEALLVQNGLPSYLFDFIERYDSKEKCLEHFAQLLTLYYREEGGRATEPFVREYLTFEREWRLVLTGFRAKRLGRELSRELQFEDANDEVVAQILAQRDAVTYEPPTRYGELKGLFEIHAENPLALHQALCEWRFAKIEELFGIEPFTIGRICGYLVQLIIVERWMALDREKGKAWVDEVVNI